MRALLKFFIACIPLLGLAQEEDISFDQLLHWDEVAYTLVGQNSIIDGNVHRLFAYLYQAQKAFSDASKGKGDIGPISLHILRLFFPKYRNQQSFDAVSQEVTESIKAPFDERFHWESKHIHPVKLAFFPNSWTGTKPYFGIYAPTMKTWFIKSAEEFRAPQPPPPSDEAFWNKQLAQVKQEMGEATDAQKYLILHWDNSDWKQIANEFMANANIPIQKRIEVRAKLAATLCDTYITLWDSKYTYLVRRPYQLDPQLNIAVADPNHPSYPCAHCGLGSAAVTLLSAFFPEQKEDWLQKLAELDLSRVQAGLHFPIDVHAGKTMGRQIGEAALYPSKLKSWVLPTPFPQFTPR